MSIVCWQPALESASPVGTISFALFAPRFSAQQRARLEADDWICRDLVDFQRMLRDEQNGEPGALPPSPKLNGME